jgi:small subunit ribosomal protein S1
MAESFAELFEQSQVETKMRPGTIVKGTVVEVRSDFVVVNAGLKSEGVIPLDQFRNNAGDIDVKVGDEIDVALDAVEDGYGETRLSREKAKRAKAWEELEKACEASATVTGVISDKVKGGFTVDISSIRAFLPGSATPATWKASRWNSR